MSETSVTDNPGARSRSTRRALALAVVALVPLAFTGIVVGALANADERLSSIPAAVVNEDELVTQTADDGTETQVLAGRLLVTELTGGDGGFDWQITNSEDAEQKLADGEVYAVLTIPSDFSSSIVSLQGDEPEQASFSILTDAAHDYIGGTIAQVVAQTLRDGVGSQLTSQYIAGLFGGLSTVGSSLGDAADGAQQLADGTDDLADGVDQVGDGAGQLADGLDQLAAGVDSAASGAGKYANGVGEYTDGVGSLSDGLGKLDKGAAALDELQSGIATYTSGVTQSSEGLTQLNAVIQAYPNVDAQTKAAMQQLTTGLSQLSGGGTTLSQGASTGIDGIQSGIHQSAVGAEKLADAGDKLAKGGDSLADGLDELADGASKSASGAGELADGIPQLGDGAAKLGDGAQELADGLTEGAEQAPSYSDDEATETAETITDPVTYLSSTTNAVPHLGQALATLLVPLGLWLGALAVFLVTRPVSRQALASTAPGRRLVLAAVARAAAVTAVQAVLLVGLLHVTLELGWSSIGLTLPFAVLMALAFTAFHVLLTLALGRRGLVLSLLLFAVQLVSTGGLYPIEVLAPVFQLLSPLLPMTHAVAGMQAIISGGSLAPLASGAVYLLIFGVASVLLSLVVVGRARRASRLGLLAPEPV
jgi:putative membrane protein